MKQWCALCVFLYYYATIINSLLVVSFIYTEKPPASDRWLFVWSNSNVDLSWLFASELKIRRAPLVFMQSVVINSIRQPENAATVFNFAENTFPIFSKAAGYSASEITPEIYIYICLANTNRNNHGVITSKWRFDVQLRVYNVVCLLGE